MTQVRMMPPQGSQRSLLQITY